MKFEQAVDIELVTNRFREETFDLILIDTQVGISQIHVTTCQQQSKYAQDPE